MGSGVLVAGFLPGVPLGPMVGDATAGKRPAPAPRWHVRLDPAGVGGRVVVAEAHTVEGSQCRGRAGMGLGCPAGDTAVVGGAVVPLDVVVPGRVGGGSSWCLDGMA